MIHRRLLQDHSLPQPPPPPPPSSGLDNDDVSSNILITVLILAIAVILCASLYLLLRFIRRRHPSTNTATLSRSSTSSSSQQRQQQPPSRRKVSPSINDPLIASLPLFSFDSLSSSGDCAVCLSKFEPQDLLRLLPICCHAFHAECIDTWLNSNQSCPLCRSPVFIPESELLSKLDNPNPNPARISSSTNGSRSFRVEIGNVSQRNSGEVNPVHRSYSLGGNFEYVLDDDTVSEVHSGSFRRTFSTEFKVDDHHQAALHHQQGVLAAEVGARGGNGGGGGWLKEYLSHSLSSSFRSSGRWFFTGSSRREFNSDNNGENGISLNNNRVTELDLEASELGDEISELFRWLSGM